MCKGMSYRGVYEERGGNSMNTKQIEAVAKTVRALSMDAVEKAKSGHPGMPMGCAELGSVIYGEILKHDPSVPDWIDRDRFVLSAGHGSMLLYSLLFLSGYGLTIEDIKNFRQLDSPTPGHPEYGCAKGVETTTGPLGAGFSNAVGMAIAETMLAATFNTDKHTIINHYTYALAGDGCLMEGVSAEAASLAGHMGLGKLIVFYDSNSITIEGSTDLTFSEDVLMRFAAYGWQTLEGDAYDVEGIAKLVDQAKQETGKPTIIRLSSVIAKGAFSKEGSHETHGAPLGEEELRKTKEKLGIPADTWFYVDPEAEAYFSEKKPEWKKRYESWKEQFDGWSKENPALRKQFDTFFASGTSGGEVYSLGNLPFPTFAEGDSVATRAASGKVLNGIASTVTNLVGGSADLAPSNKTLLDNIGHYSRQNRRGRNLHFGVREHAMAGISNGIALHGGLRPYCGTFLVFADYMRPGIRLAALMGIPVIFVFTHDSIFVGEDGPTHQPIEQLASLRVIPGLRVLRPGDAQETAAAWAMALNNTSGPTALSLTRQKLSVYPKADSDWVKTIQQGAYIAKDCDGTPDVVVVATGSEVGAAFEAAEQVQGKKIRVVSMMCRELFLEQEAQFRNRLLPRNVPVVVAEAGASFGWEAVAGDSDYILGINHFGASGPGAEVAKHCRLVPEELAKLIERV